MTAVLISLGLCPFWFYAGFSACSKRKRREPFAVWLGLRRG